MQNLSDPGGNASQPQVAVRRATGDAVFAWVRFDGANYRVQARTRLATGGLSPAQNISNPSQDAAAPQVAVDADGDAVLAWQRSDGANTLIEARSRSAAGILRPFTTLSDPGRDAINPQVAVDDPGDATVAWVRFDGANQRIQASAGP